MGYILPNGSFEKPKLNRNYYDTGDIGNGNWYYLLL